MARVLSVELFDDGAVRGGDDGRALESPAGGVRRGFDRYGGVAVVIGDVGVIEGHSLFSVMADWAAPRSTIDLLPA